MTRWPWFAVASGSADPARSGSGSPLRPWSFVRALLITLALLLHVSLGAPWPDLGERDLRYDLADDELARWSAALGAVGVSMTPEQLADRVVAIGRWSRKTQKALHGPARPLLRLTGTGQAWGLFAFPDPYPGRLVVSAKGAGGSSWRELYRAPGQGEAWLVDLLEYRKIRGIYDDAGDRPRAGFLWNRLCDAVARRVFLRHDDIDLVELRFDVLHVTAPGQGGGRGGERVRHRRRRTRAALVGDVPGAAVEREPSASAPDTEIGGPVGTP